MKAPKGFDILLAEAIDDLDLTLEQIKTLGVMTAKREIACAKVGNRTWYRRATLERLFVDGK